MSYPVTGVILAGGRNKRFQGRQKAFIQIGKKRLLDRIYDLFVDLFDEIILVTNKPLLYSSWDLTIVTDLIPVRSSLTGIHAGLFYAAHPFTFVSACDTPFLKKDLVIALVESAHSSIDIVIPETVKGKEPLCAVYSRRCQSVIEHQLARNRFKIQNFINRMRVKTFSEKKIRRIDPHLSSFMNINSPEDLATARKLVTWPEAS